MRNSAASPPHRSTALVDEAWLKLRHYPQLADTSTAYKSIGESAKAAQYKSFIH